MLIIVAIAAGAAIMAGQAFAPACTLVQGAGSTEASLEGLSPGAARFFCYQDRAGHHIRFMIARDAEGGVEAVLDACKQCYRYHKGYSVADGYLICRMCGNRYKIERAGTGRASCQPVHLDTVRRGNAVEVKLADLEKHRELF